MMTRKQAHKDLTDTMTSCAHCCTLHKRVGPGPDGVSGCELAYEAERETPALTVDDITLVF